MGLYLKPVIDGDCGLSPLGSICPLRAVCATVEERPFRAALGREKDLRALAPVVAFEAGIEFFVPSLIYRDRLSGAPSFAFFAKGLRGEDRFACLQVSSSHRGSYIP